MHVLAFLAYLRDLYDAKSVLARIHSAEECGFAPMGDDQAWTWYLEQDDHSAETVFQVSGTAVNFCGVLGLPYSRIRSSIPEEILPGKVPHAVGRQGGLSSHWLGKHAKAAESGEKGAVQDELAETHAIMWGTREAVQRVAGEGGPASAKDAGGMLSNKVAPLPPGADEESAKPKPGVRGWGML